MSDWRNREVEDAFWKELGETSHHILPQQDGKFLEERASCRLHISLVNDGGKNAVLPPALGSMSAVSEVIPSASQDGHRATYCFNEYNIGAKICEYGSQHSNVISEGTLDDSKYCTFPLNSISPADNKLDYMESNKVREDDLFYYELPDISNLEDLDEVLRNCDSTFGERSNNARFSSSSNEIYVSENTSNSGLQCSPPELRAINSKSSCSGASSLTRRTGPPITNDLSCIDYQNLKLDSATEQVYHAGGGSSSESAVTQFCNDYGFQDINNSNMINMQMKLYEGQMSSDLEGENQLQCCTSSRSVSISNHVQQYTDQNNFPSSFYSPGSHSFEFSGKADGFLDPEFPNYLPTSNPPSQVQSCFPSPEDLFMHMVNKANNDVKLKDVVRNPGPGSLKQNTSAKKQYFDQDSGKNKMIMQQKASVLDAFVVDKSSSMPCVHLNDDSAQSVSFKKLQNVMSQLDVRTKICIRDSLYRLARSAEERHNITCTSGGGTDHRRGAYGTGKQINSGEHLNIETETNPIDRSIAHLLFHRPSEIVAKPADDPMLLESDTIPKQIDGPIIPNR